MADRMTKPKIQLPPEFNGDEGEFLRDMRHEFALDEAYDTDNRNAGIEDLGFLVGDQWDQTVKSRRINARKPVMTINRLPAFVAQVLGARLQNETAIRIIPDTNGDKQVARVREGLMRSIQKASQAESAFDNALQGSVCAGIGNFQVVLDYENEEVWHQSLNIAPVADHFAVVWDRSRTEPTGRDAGRCYVVESMPDTTFRSEYPWAQPADIMSAQMSAELAHGEWFSGNTVRIVSYWQMRERRRTIALMANGETVDITDVTDPRQLENIMRRPDGSRYIREVYRKYARMYRCSGADVLEGPYDLPIDRVPVFRVPGWEVRVGGKVHRWGMIRFMKDPQRLHNYWRSAIAEKIMQSPRATWVASDEAVAGREKEWRDSNKSDNPLLIYNGAAGDKPMRTDPIQMEQALILQADVTAQDLKDVSNVHEANLGMPSNEVSGKAIQERIGVSETGNLIYHVNLAKAIEECGRTCNALMPVVYDTPRVVATLGEGEAEPLMQAINGMTDDSIDITAGKYRVTVTTGPSYKTKRIEQAENMMGMAQAMPNVLGLAADMIVEAQDWPNAEKIAERIRMGMDPAMLSEENMTPAIQQSIKQRAQQQQQQIEAAVQQAMDAHLESQAQVALDTAKARKTDAEASVIPAETRNNSLRVVSDTASKRLQDTLSAIETAQPQKSRAQSEK